MAQFDRLHSAAAAVELASQLPRVLIVSRRTVRKNKFVNFVGEYHLDLIVKYGAVPIIVPRVSGLHLMLDSFEPIHGVLLCEGEDVDPGFYESDLPSLLSVEEIEEIKKLHSSDTSIDKDKDSIEFQLARRCLERNIPFLGICRGSQVLNVASGGSLFQDVERQLPKKGGVVIKHINYENYDGHRHLVQVEKGAPLHEWFKESLSDEKMELLVNSYHHQGVRRLAPRFSQMAVASDGLVEAFYDPSAYDPALGKFIVGLQFHPERMRHEQDTNHMHVDFDSSKHESVFDYPGCPRAYQEFVRSVIKYKERLDKGNESQMIGHGISTAAIEEQRKEILHSFSVAKRLYDEYTHEQGEKMDDDENAEMEALTGFQEDNKDLRTGAQFLQSCMAFSEVEEKRLTQIGATVRNSLLFRERLNAHIERDARVKTVLNRLPTHELHEHLEYHTNMASLISQVLATRTF